jgi:HMG (high mobility group) box
MMNKEELQSEMNLKGRNIGIEDIEAERPDDLKPTAKVASAGKLSPDSPDRKVKRKRRSPEKPWKKPADMPKRPLSAYNIFFRDERERILGTGSEGKREEEDESRTTGKSGTKKQKKTSGIGFANLAKSIAAKWKELEDDVRLPYEKIAATEKKKYDELVAEWRLKQAAKKKALAAAKKEEDNERKNAPMYREPPAPNLFSSERSLGSFSDTSNPYPPEWFHSAEGSEREDRGMSRSSAVPPVVDMSSEPSYDRRSYDSSMASPGWHYMQDPISSYYMSTGSHHHGYDEADPYPRYSPDTQRTSYPGSYSPDASSTRVPVYSGAYRDYYHHTPQSIYQPPPASHSSRYSDVRSTPRSSSLPMPRHSDTTSLSMASSSLQPQASSLSSQSRRGSPHQYHHLQQHSQMHTPPSYRRSSRDGSLSSSTRYQPRGGGGTQSYPRSASMPGAVPSPPTMLGGTEGGGGLLGSHHHLRRRGVVGGAAAGGSSSTSGSGGGGAMMILGGDEPMLDASYRSAPQLLSSSASSALPLQPPLLGMAIAAGPPHATTTADRATTTEAAAVDPETSLHTLTESLDEDAISFITSMKYS